MIKVGMPPVPIAVPVHIMACHDVIAEVRESLIRLPGDQGTRRLYRGAGRLRLEVRWMSKCRKTWSCALKARNTTGNVHPAKTDAATAIADSACGASASTEPAAVETAAAETCSTATMTGSYQRLARRGKSRMPIKLNAAFVFMANANVMREGVTTAHVWYLLLNQK
jgi:hypothetical protein